MREDDDFILDIDESRSANPPRELTGWEWLIFEIADVQTEDREPRTED